MPESCSPSLYDKTHQSFAPNAMHYLVGYDIASPRRLRRVARILEGYGYRVQYSIFLCDLSAPAYEDLVESLSARLDLAEDRVFLLPVCQACQQRMVELGTSAVPDLQETCIIV